MGPNAKSFSQIAELAIKNPEVWVTAREGQTSANLVTRIRKGLVSDFPLDGFQARSSSYTDGKVGQAKIVYDIEVMHTPKTSAGVVRSFTLAQFNQVIQDADVQKAIVAALARL